MRSTFQDKRGFGPLLAQYVGRFPTYVQDLQAARAAGDLATVRKLTHQLKGSAGSYGFPRISEVAARAQTLADDGTDESALATALGELMMLLLGASREASGESA